MMNFLQDVVSSNSFCNHNCEWVSRFMHIESRWRQRWLTMIPSFKLWHDVKLWIGQLYVYFPKDVIWRVVKSSSRVKRVKGQLWPKLRKVRIWFQFDDGFQRINAYNKEKNIKRDGHKRCLEYEDGCAKNCFVKIFVHWITGYANRWSAKCDRSRW